MVDRDLLSALKRIRPSNELNLRNLRRRGEFLKARSALKRLLDQQISDHVAEIALLNALHRLGYRFGERSALTPEEAAERIEAAVYSRRAEQTWSVPLDGADELTRIKFGCAEVRSRAPSELLEMSAWGGSNNEEAQRTAEELANFRWLIVKELIPVCHRFAHRVSLIYRLMDERRLGGWFSTEPHPRVFPPVVEIALGALLVLPWEDVIHPSAPDWRPFRTPWLHSYTTDLFAPLEPLPRAGTLTWEESLVRITQSGEEIFEERPAIRALHHQAGTFVRVSAPPWESFSRFVQSIAGQRPVLHFFLRAFMSRGIDELMAHIVTLDAMLGKKQDHSPGRRSFGRCNPGGTKRISWRLAALLDDEKAADEFRRLYHLRSNYIHGRCLNPIPECDLRSARKLVRLAICAAIDGCCGHEGAKDYERFLDDLLDKGFTMCGPASKR